MEQVGCADGRSGKPSVNGRRSSSVGPVQRSHSLSPTAARGRGKAAASPSLQQASTTARLSFIGERGRPPRPPSAQIVSSRPVVTVSSRTEKSGKALTKMGERQRSSSLPTWHDGTQKPQAGRLQLYSSLSAKQRGSHMDGLYPTIPLKLEMALSKQQTPFS